MRKKYRFISLCLGIFCVFLFIGNRSYAQETISGYAGAIHQNYLIDGEDYFVLNTDVAIYFIKNDSVVRVLQTFTSVKFFEVIPDQNGNGYDEYLVIYNTTQHENIYLYDGEQNDILWTYGMDISVYDAKVGYGDQLLSIEDYSVASNRLFFVADYFVFSLNMNGQLLWKIDENTNLWSIETIGDINHDNIPDCIMSLQTNGIEAISGKDGKVIYHKEILSSLPDLNTPNIWDLAFDENGQLLYGLDEFSNLYQIDPLTGKILESKRLNDQLNKTYNRFNLEFKSTYIHIVGDEDEDQVNDLVIVMTATYGPSGVKMPKEIYAVSGRQLMIRQDYTSDHDLLNFGTYMNKQVVYRITNYSTTTSEMFSGTLLDSNNLGTRELIIGVDGQSLFTWSNEGLIITHLDTKIIAIIPYCYLTNIEQKNDSLLTTKYSYNNGIMSIKSESIESETLNWEWSPEVGMRLQLIDNQSDLNDDGQNDFVFLESKIDSYAWEQTLMVLDGSSGTPIFEKSIPIPLFYYDYNSSLLIVKSGCYDQTFYFVTFDGSIFQFDTQTGEMTNFSINNTLQIYPDIPNLVYFSFSTGIIRGSHYFFIDGGELKKVNLANPDEVTSLGLIKSDQFQTMADFDGDDLPDFYVETSEETWFYSTRDDQFIVGPLFSEATMDSTGFDLTGDGYDEMFVYQRYNQYFTLRVIDIVHGDVLFELPYYFLSYSSYPKNEAVLYQKDQNFYLAVNKYNSKNNANKLEIYPINSDEPKKSFYVDDTFIEDQFILMDLYAATTEGQNYLYFLRTESKIYDSDRYTKIFHVESGMIECDFKGNYSQLIIEDGQVIIMGETIKKYSLSSDPFVLVPSNSFTSTTRYPLHFDNPQHEFIMIYVDGTLYGVTNQEMYRLNLLEGEHTVRIEMFTKDNFRLYQSFDIKATKATWVTDTFYVIPIILFLSIIGITHIKKKY